MNKSSKQRITELHKLQTEYDELLDNIESVDLKKEQLRRNQNNLSKLIKARETELLEYLKKRYPNV